MKLTIFDLDNTLLSGDSDYLWGQFLIEQGLVDKQYYERENLRFYKEYEAGTLDIYEFLQFSLKPLADNDIHFLTELRNKFIIEKKPKNNHKNRLGLNILVCTYSLHYKTIWEIV